MLEELTLWAFYPVWSIVTVAVVFVRHARWPFINIRWVDLK